MNLKKRIAIIAIFLFFSLSKASSQPYDPKSLFDWYNAPPHSISNMLTNNNWNLDSDYYSNSFQSNILQVSHGKEWLRWQYNEFIKVFIFNSYNPQLYLDFLQYLKTKGYTEAGRKKQANSVFITYSYSNSYTLTYNMVTIETPLNEEGLPIYFEYVILKP